MRFDSRPRPRTLIRFGDEALLGPHDYAQLTYEALTITDGEEVGYIDGPTDKEEWTLNAQKAGGTAMVREVAIYGHDGYPRLRPTTVPMFARFERGVVDIWSANYGPYRQLTLDGPKLRGERFDNTIDVLATFNEDGVWVGPGGQWWSDVVIAAVDEEGAETEETLVWPNDTAFPTGRCQCGGQLVRMETEEEGPFPACPNGECAFSGKWDGNPAHYEEV